MKASKIQELRERRRKIIITGGEDKLKARHEKGLLTARERLEALFQPETFQETGMHIRHCGQHFGSANKELPADAVITGTGYVNGQLIAAVSEDFTVAGGTLGKMHAAKIVDVMKFALNNGVPVVAFKDSGGARIHEGVHPCPATVKFFTTTFFCPVLCLRSPSSVDLALEERLIHRR